MAGHNETEGAAERGRGRRRQRVTAEQAAGDRGAAVIPAGELQNRLAQRPRGESGLANKICGFLREEE